jgi:hypothetical protein
MAASAGMVPPAAGVEDAIWDFKLVGMSALAAEAGC